MFSESLVERDTIQAFLLTEYHVYGESPFTLRIGESSSDLAAAYKRHGSEFGAYITACNPLSRQLDVSANAARHASFRRELIELNLSFIEGEGRHPSNGWPREPSFLILGIDFERAGDLSIRLQQDALVWASSDCVPQLVLLR